MSSIDKIVHDLAYEMAKISTDYNVEKDYNNQEKLHNLAREITLNEEEINFKINEMYADVEREANSLNTNIPSDLRYKIARNIETKMGSGKASISDITISAGEMKYFMSEQKYDEPNGIFVSEMITTSMIAMETEKIKEYFSYSNIDIEGVEVIDNKIFVGDTEIYFEASEDERFNFESKEEAIEERGIVALEELIKNTLNESKEKGTEYLRNNLTQLLKLSPEKLGIQEDQTGIEADALLYVLKDVFRVGDSDARLADILSDPVNAELLKIAEEFLTPENLEEIGFRRDKYTEAILFDLSNVIINDNSLDKNSQEYCKLAETFEKLSPKIYEVLKEDPNLRNKILSTTNESDIINSAIKADSVETVDDFTNFILRVSKNENIKSNEKDKLDSSPDKRKNEYHAIPNSITAEEKINNLQRVFDGKYKVKGKEGIKAFLESTRGNAGNIIAGANKWIRNNDELSNDEVFMTEYYNIILGKTIQEEEILESAVELNPNSSKKALEEFIEKSNDGSQEKMSSIVLFGKAVKQVEEELEENKPLSNEKNNTNSLDSSDGAR